jgi:hypothetical protein
MLIHELPLQFTAELEGADVVNLPVVGERLLLLGRDHVDGDPRAAALANFLDHFADEVAPAEFEPRAALYELRNLDSQPFWVGQNSSMGQRNNQRIIEAFAKLAPPLGIATHAELGGFERRASMLLELLGEAHTDELTPAADAIAKLIAALISEPEHAPVDREIYVRTTVIDEFSGDWTRAFIVDATPFAGPEEFAWLVVWTDAWIE